MSRLRLLAIYSVTFAVLSTAILGLAPFSGHLQDDHHAMTVENCGGVHCEHDVPVSHDRDCAAKCLAAATEPSGETLNVSEPGNVLKIQVLKLIRRVAAETKNGVWKYQAPPPTLALETVLSDNMRP